MCGWSVLSFLWDSGYYKQSFWAVIGQRQNINFYMCGSGLWA